MAEEFIDDEIPVLSQLGRSGLPFYAGYIQAETLPALSGHRWRRVCKEMGNDPVIGAVLFALEHLFKQVDFQFVAADDSPQAAEYRDFYQNALDDMSRTWKDTLSEISTFLQWGFAPLELVYKQRKGLTPGTIKAADGTEHQLPVSKYNDGRFGWNYWPLRAQDTVEKWEFSLYGDVEAMYQLSPPDWQWVKIPSKKMLLFRTSVKSNNPEGRSIVRPAYNPWFFRTNYQRFEGIGVERNLAGLPVFRIPSSIINATASSPEYATLQNFQRAVTNIRRDEQMGLLIPSDCDASGKPLYEFSLMSSSSTQSVDMESKIQRLDQRMLMSVMMDFLLLGHQKVGSFALADSKTELFITALGGFLDTICEVITRDAVPRLAELNSFTPELLPRLEHGDVETQDLGLLGEYISKLSGVDAISFPTEDGRLEAHLLRQAGLPVSEATTKPKQEKKPKGKPEQKPKAERAPGNKDDEKSDGNKQEGDNADE